MEYLLFDTQLFSASAEQNCERQLFQPYQKKAKRRPALVLVGLQGDDLILCQIASQFMILVKLGHKSASVLVEALVGMPALKDSTTAIAVSLNIDC